jgi:hypothetical protein
MSDPAAIATGIGIGLLIVLPVFVVLRHEIAQNLRNLLGSSTVKDETQNQTLNKQSGGGVSTVASGDRSGGISSGVAMFGVAVAAVVTLYGVLSGSIVFIISGIFVMSSMLLAFIVS